MKNVYIKLNFIKKNNQMKRKINLKDILMKFYA